jgi:hypothetical protein
VHDELTGDFVASDVLLYCWLHDYRRNIVIREMCCYTVGYMTTEEI